MHKITRSLGLLAAFGVAACGTSPTAPESAAGERVPVASATSGTGTATTQTVQIGHKNPPPTVQVSWRVPLPTGGDPPIPGDPVRFHCDASDPNGDTLTVTLQLTSDTGSCATTAHCWSMTGSSDPERPDTAVVLDRSGSAPDPGMRGTLTCTAVDARGATTVRSRCFNMAGFACPA
jgi:hypothetical protein